jgi:serine/threonine protein kinase
MSGPHSATGQRLTAAGYEVLEVIGRGGMGVVYKARQRNLDRLVAIKMIKDGNLADPEDLARFETEARAIAKLTHPNIIGIHDYIKLDDHPCFVLEFLEHGTLEERLTGQPIDPNFVVPLVEALANALDHAHRHGIIHRDLKPANILYNSDGVPKITDFGLARVTNVQAQTATGIAVGTPAYMAPEQALGHTKRIGPACDVWACGVIMYELLTGRLPFLSDSALETLNFVIQTDPPLPRQVFAGVPLALEAICLKCLQKDPGKRYASAAELVADLARYRAGKITLALSERRPAAKAPGGIGLAPVLVGLVGALLLVLVGVALVFLIWPSDPGPSVRVNPPTHSEAPPTVPPPPAPPPPPMTVTPTADGALSPEEASKRVGQKCTVRFKIASTGQPPNDKSIVFLNSQSHFRDANNFTVVVKLAELERRKPEWKTIKLLQGLNVRATGTVRLFGKDKAPQLDAEELAID